MGLGKLLSNKLKELRRDKSQQWLADKLNTSRATINRWEVHGAESVTIEELEAISKLFGIDASELLKSDRHRNEVVHLTQVRRDQIIGEIVRNALKLSDEDLDGLLRDSQLSLTHQLSDAPDSLEDIK